MATNQELLAQAITAIPLWRAFLDKKEAEQDALLAEVRAELSEESEESTTDTTEFKAPSIPPPSEEEVENIKHPDPPEANHTAKAKQANVQPVAQTLPEVEAPDKPSKDFDSDSLDEFKDIFNS